jgi:signal transduction histidine kinase
MDSKTHRSQHLLDALERLLQIPTGDLRTCLIHGADVLAQVLGADKVDGFLYDPARDSLVALGTSNQPLSALQRKLGLDVLQIANGGRVVHVYKTGKTFMTGRLDLDEVELHGPKHALGIRSKLGVPLEIGGATRGMVMIASLQPNYFTDEDARFAETVVRWLGVLAHRAELAEQTRRNAVEQGRRAVAEELVAVVAHDVRNYLTPIGLRLELLRRLAERNQQAQQLPELEAARNAVAQLGSLVSDLLDVTRIDEGLFRMQPALVDLHALVEESARTLGTPQVKVDVRLQAMGKPVVPGDGRRLRQCIDNLIANAVQHSPKGGTVTIVISSERGAESEMARVNVIDEGPGVSPEMASQIFDRFATKGHERSGLGLGLYLAKRIAEIHGGDIAVDSSPGRGAQFTLQLPCRLER